MITIDICGGRFAVFLQYIWKILRPDEARQAAVRSLMLLSCIYDKSALEFAYRETRSKD